MAKITLQKIRHSYAVEGRLDTSASESNPSSNKTSTSSTTIDWALEMVDLDWSDGGAYALLGPSGCGKSTLLNIISGLLKPTQGRVLFDGKDVTDLPSEKREIAQVFQFPVVYDTMTVFDNLAFPLKNRRVDTQEIEAKVNEIAEMLDLQSCLSERASGLTADGKQKISLGRGLVRDNVNVIMFDEPLTVIDPHLKWQLRSKLKELHQRLGVTMIYVTHDQTEALTFADKVVVMHDGIVVQVGTPEALFERPQHTFVGHFIGSPGMNLLPCEWREGSIYLSEHKIHLVKSIEKPTAGQKLELGIRPEFVSFSNDGIPVNLIGLSDAGRFQIAEVSLSQSKGDNQAHDDSESDKNLTMKILLPDGKKIPEGTLHIKFDRQYSLIYSDGWLIE